MNHDDGMAAADPDRPTTTVYVHAVIARLRDDEFLLTVRHRDGWHMLPGGPVQAGEAARDGLRRRLRELLGVEVSDIDFVTAIEGEPSTDQNQITLIFDAPFAAEDDMEIISHERLWTVEWVRWDDIESTNFKSPTLCRRLAAGTLREQAWWSPSSSPS